MTADQATEMIELLREIRDALRGGISLTRQSVTFAGYTCANCGLWVGPGWTHNCTPQRPIYQYPNTSSSVR